MLRNLKFHYLVLNSPPLFQVLSVINTIQALQTDLRSALILYSHVCLGFQVLSFLRVFPPFPCTRHSSSPHCHMLHPSHYFSFCPTVNDMTQTPLKHSHFQCCRWRDGISPVVAEGTVQHRLWLKGRYITGCGWRDGKSPVVAEGTVNHRLWLKGR